MTNLIDYSTTTLARRSSRRQFVKFVGALSLGVGYVLAGVEPARAYNCSSPGCHVVPPCPGCSSTQGSVDCFSLNQTYCKSCQNGGGCNTTPPCPGCAAPCSLVGEWYCCKNVGGYYCKVRCSECCCGPPLTRACHCFIGLPVSCTPGSGAAAPDTPCVCL